MKIKTMKYESNNRMDNILTASALVGIFLAFAGMFILCGYPEMAIPLNDWSSPTNIIGNLWAITAILLIMPCFFVAMFQRPRLVHTDIEVPDGKVVIERGTRIKLPGTNEYFKLSQPMIVKAQDGPVETTSSE